MCLQTSIHPGEGAQRQAQWLLWQMGRVTAEADAREPQPIRQAQMAEFPAITLNRGRYESVVRRMQQAGQRTGTYTAWN